jgi:hypothetical protein
MLGTYRIRPARASAFPSEPAEIGHVLTYFNSPLQSDGYAYADRQTVVIAYVVPSPPHTTVEDALAAILANLD